MLLKFSLYPMIFIITLNNSIHGSDQAFAEFDKLPKNVIKHIFTYLDKETQEKTAKVCKRFFHIINDIRFKGEYRYDLYSEIELALDNKQDLFHYDIRKGNSSAYIACLIKDSNINDMQNLSRFLKTKKIEMFQKWCRLRCDNIFILHINENDYTNRPCIFNLRDEIMPLISEFKFSKLVSFNLSVRDLKLDFPLQNQKIKKINLLQMPNLKEINLSGTGMFWSHLAYLEKLPKLQKIIFKKNNLGYTSREEKEGKFLIKFNDLFLLFLETLDLSDNELYDDNVEKLTELNVIKKLKNFDLSLNNLNGKGIFSFLACNTTLQALDLSINKIDSAFFSELKLKTDFIYLTSLNLSNNPLGDAGGEAFSKFKYPYLKDLTMYGVGLGDKGFRAIVESEDLAELQNLNASQNVITGEELTTVRNKLTNLLTLNLSGNELGKKGIKSLIESKLLKNLQKLILSNNKFTDAHIFCLCENKFSYLSYLDISCNLISNNGALQLSNGKFPHLITLIAHENSIGIIGGNALAESQNFKLKTLDLGYDVIEGFMSQYKEEGQPSQALISVLKSYLEEESFSNVCRN